MTTGRDAAHPAASAPMIRRRAQVLANRSARAAPVAMQNPGTKTGGADALPNAPARRTALTAGKRAAVVDPVNKGSAVRHGNRDRTVDPKAIVDPLAPESVQVPIVVGQADQRRAVL